MSNFFSPNGNALRVTPGVEYDPKITHEIDRQIRHMPAVIERMLERAGQLRRSAGENFEIIISANPKQQRPRAYVVPKNDKGIHEELAQGVLLKAALGMSGR